ncbi:hypothetical protein ACJMK2_036441 [Sinanodonta woodiana]|uniref:Golgin-84 n=1 Tax=Sinanodonta woodiana TaxID=1069815 RepID=A0ABD3WH83_SINWO
MSWLTSLTGKAEEYLNKLDQSAAHALKTSDEESKFQESRVPLSQPDYGRGALAIQSSKSQASTSGQTVSRQTSLTPSQSVPSKLHELKQDVDPASSWTTIPVRQSASNVSKSEPKKKMDTDEALFEFLNSPDFTDSSKKKTQAGSARHSRQSSTSSVVSSRGNKTAEGSAPSSTSTSGSSMVHVELPGTGSGRGSPSEQDVTADIATLVDAMQDHSPSHSVHSNQDLESHSEVQHNVSSLELENRLLKNEVASLNQEMASVIQRAKDSQTELVRLKSKLDEYNRSASNSDQIARELQAREQDLTEALHAKDSQLAVLRIRLEEADREIEKNKKTLQKLQEDRQRILSDHTSSSGVHSQALESLKEKLTEVEASLQREQEAYKQAQQEASQRQSKLEEEQRSLAEALTTANKRLTEEKNKVSDLNAQIKLARSNSDAVKHELAEYKEKATRILQSKDRLISSLREGSESLGEGGGVSSLEFDAVKQERDMLKEELHKTKLAVENLRMELQEMEAQLQQETVSSQDQIHTLEDNFREEKQRREDAEQEILKQKRELQYAIEELHKQKTAFQSRLSDRETEIDKLRNQLSTKSMSSTTEYELESRVRALTESLIQKQTIVEALSTEKNSLTLQLERLEQQYRDVQVSSVRTNTAVIPVHEEDEVRPRLPGFMREGPTDTPVTRKMKRAANTIDKFSIRLGVFLRRYPIARVFVIVYMVLLHLWVMIVLLTYQPEIHDGPEKNLPLAPTSRPNSFP